MNSEPGVRVGHCGVQMGPASSKGRQSPCNSTLVLPPAETHTRAWALGGAYTPAAGAQGEGGGALH